MKAMVLAGFGAPADRPLELRDIPVPDVGPEDILIKVRCCGVCHTDLHVVEHELAEARLPLVPGHEVIGTVERTGEKAGRFDVGQRVGAAWLRSACGVCRFCRSGRENLCESALFNGYHADGGYAEYMAVGEKFAYAVPDGFGDAEAAPLDVRRDRRLPGARSERGPGRAASSGSTASAARPTSPSRSPGIGASGSSFSPEAPSTRSLPASSAPSGWGRRKTSRRPS